MSEGTTYNFRHKGRLTTFAINGDGSFLVYGDIKIERGRDGMLEGEDLKTVVAAFEEWVRNRPEHRYIQIKEEK